MKQLSRLLMVFTIGVMFSCSSVRVVTDKDKTVDFTNYKTFTFLGWQNGSDALLNDFDKRRMRDAFAAEFDARNLKHVETGGDMQIALYIVLDQRSSITAYTDYYGTMGYNYRWNGGWGMGHSRTSYTENEYVQGTLVMDVFDGGNKDQIWQAVATATVSENPSRRERTIPNRVRSIMREFPIEPVE